MTMTMGKMSRAAVEIADHSAKVERFMDNLAVFLDEIVDGEPGVSDATRDRAKVLMNTLIYL